MTPLELKAARKRVRLAEKQKPINVSKQLRRELNETIKSHGRKTRKRAS
jgi:hypothetical protein